MRPFRDALVELFFVTVGMKIDPATVLSSPLAVLMFLVAFLVLKALVIGLVGALMRWPTATATRLALVSLVSCCSRRPWPLGWLAEPQASPLCSPLPSALGLRPSSFSTMAPLRTG